MPFKGCHLPTPLAASHVYYWAYGGSRSGETVKEVSEANPSWVNHWEWYTLVFLSLRSPRHAFSVHETSCCVDMEGRRISVIPLLPWLVLQTSRTFYCSSTVVDRQCHKLGQMPIRVNGMVSLSQPVAPPGKMSSNDFCNSNSDLSIQGAEAWAGCWAGRKCNGLAVARCTRVGKPITP